MGDLEPMTSGGADTCWACGSNDLDSIFSVDSIPLSSLILMDDVDEAKRFPRGGLELVVCNRCAFMYNRRFRPEAVDYTLPYESSQDFSPTFRAFRDELIDHLVTGYELTGKQILEIGCGDASFLLALSERANATGFCIDPTFDGSRLPTDGNVSGIEEFYDASKIHLTGDLICCRHTLEHIQPVGEFVGLVHDSAQRTEGSIVFFEIPDTDRILDEGAFWDVYYEHCSYFTLTSLAQLFESQGFEVLRLGRGYEDQYLLIDCVVGEASSKIERPPVDVVLERANSFRINTEKAVAEWKGMIEEASDRGENVVLWGASSKAVAFIASMGSDASISAAVDINPHKQDRFLPGSGHAVIAPEKLVEINPDLVIVMNPIYIDEINDTLTELGLTPRVHALGEATR
jgi:hypothetical protein